MSPTKPHHQHQQQAHHHQPPVSAVHASAALFPDSDFTASFHASQNLMISCGCVPVDPARRLIALLHDPHTGITQLPKGRKNIGEDVARAALRETCEETGLLGFRLLPLRVATRATPTAEMLDAHFGTATPSAAAAAAAEAAAGGAGAVGGPTVSAAATASNGSGSGNGQGHEVDTADTAADDDDAQWHNLEDVTSWQPNTEPIAVTTRRCRGTLALKLVLWYVAEGDSTAESHAADTREAWEAHYILEWVDARDAPGRMTFPTDASVVEKALDDMRRSGYDI
ncbi:hypothetical protein JDV02_009882 [Purpureocillium takamizusanense]|uniref:Nudix hydrolase domain-containing protein n=1 Tax=Purpureocillium takamizusanense TaxID=2060973 RepID=A0A9Q8QSN0_9HYPO|nr:uncharacterized protein JDV02_009882 [Purpureocillium takamizusanense]UNI24106.1 hypothetical protein JDV02_009882 [Purpureocillium takamizusanense]